jgi:hypothetical protein
MTNCLAERIEAYPDLAGSLSDKGEQPLDLFFCRLRAMGQPSCEVELADVAEQPGHLLGRVRQETLALV